MIWATSGLCSERDMACFPHLLFLVIFLLILFSTLKKLMFYFIKVAYLQKKCEHIAESIIQLPSLSASYIIMVHLLHSLTNIDTSAKDYKYFVHRSLVFTSCLFPFLGLHSRYHNTFISHVSLRSFGYDSLIFLTLIVVTGTGQIFVACPLVGIWLMCHFCLNCIYVF